MGTVLNREKTFDSPTTAFGDFVREILKHGLHTAMPGLIDTFDAASRRARVRPALQLVTAEGEALERSPALNVPVLFPSGGGFSVLVPLSAGDPVWMMFSERGLSAFKRTFDLAIPDVTRFFDESDAVVLAGFGPLEVAPATETGLSLQTNDGARSVRVEEDAVEVHSENARVRVGSEEVVVDVDGPVVLNADEVHVGGRSGQRLATEAFVERYYNVHTHSLPMGVSGPPLVAAPGRPGGDVTEKQRSE